LCEVAAATDTPVEFSNCKITSAQAAAPVAAGGNAAQSLRLINCAVANSPTAIVDRSYFGQVLSTADVSRTGGASIQGVASAWLVTTTANANQYAPYVSPWIYGTTTSGAKTFDVFITNDTGDFNNAEVWLEVEYLGTSGSPVSVLATDKVGPIGSGTTSPGSVSRDDTTSSWSGGASGFDTYKQRLRVSATVGQAGIYRARVCVGLGGIASTRDFYIDPKVTVT
jgi:hypothetical protein